MVGDDGGSGPTDHNNNHDMAKQRQRQPPANYGEQPTDYYGSNNHDMTNNPHGQQSMMTAAPATRPTIGPAQPMATAAKQPCCAPCCFN
jgi:hypothetical protein